MYLYIWIYLNATRNFEEFNGYSSTRHPDQEKPRQAFIKPRRPSYSITNKMCSQVFCISDDEEESNILKCDYCIFNNVQPVYVSPNYYDSQTKLNNSLTKLYNSQTKLNNSQTKLNILEDTLAKNKLEKTALDREVSNLKILEKKCRKKDDNNERSLLAKIPNLVSTRASKIEKDSRNVEEA